MSDNRGDAGGEIVAAHAGEDRRHQEELYRAVFGGGVGAEGWKKATGGGGVRRGSEMAMLSKLLVIERHLIASAQMIAVGVNPISTHVTVMACDEMIVALGNARGVDLKFDLRKYMQDKNYVEFRRVMRIAYNYFKHADRDAGDEFDFAHDEELCAVNEIMTYMNAIRYIQLGGTNTLACAYVQLMKLRRPELFNREMLDADQKWREHSKNVERMPSLTVEAFRQNLLQRGLLPEIVQIAGVGGPHSTRP
jgi:hypothetical protein